MIFIKNGSPKEKASFVRCLLDAYDYRGVMMEMHDKEGVSGSGINAEHASILNAISDHADDQARHDDEIPMPEVLSVNASELIESLVMLVAAIRDELPYAEARADWERPALDILPQECDFMHAEHRPTDEMKQPPSDVSTLPLDEHTDILVSGRGEHWVRSAGAVVCGPGKSAVRVTPDEHRGNDYGAVHFAFERMFNIGEPKSQTSLTIGGYKSRIRAWNIMTSFAEEMGLSVSREDYVPDYDDYGNENIFSFPA